MRSYLIFIAICILLSCEQEQEDRQFVKEPAFSEKDARKWFEDSIANRSAEEYSSEVFPRFLKKFYPELKLKFAEPLIYAMEESFVDTASIDTAKHLFRVTVDPCFRRPYCLIVEKTG